MQVVFAAGLAVALDSVAAILVIAALLGTGFAIAQPAEFALVPVIAGDERLTEVNGLVETARYAGMTAGPLIGGLSRAGGTEFAILINAATFGVVALAALLPAGAAASRARRATARARAGRRRLPVQGPHARAGGERGFRLAAVHDRVGDGRGLLPARGPRGLRLRLRAGLLRLDDGDGAGALLVARRVPASAMGVGVLIAVAVQGAGLGLPTVWLVVPFGAAMWFIGGIGHGTKNVLARTLIQQRVPARLHGRAFAAYNGLRNGAELVALAGGGVLVSAIGGRATLAIAGAVPVVAALVGLGLFLRARTRSPEPSLT